MIAIPTLDFSSINHDAFRREIREALSVFNEIDQPLKDRIVDYLINGQDVEVLLDLRSALSDPQRPKFFKALEPNDPEIVPIDFQLGSRLLKLFNRPITPAGYYQRLGKVCSQYPDLDRAYVLSDERMPRWFNDLIRFAVSLKLRVDLAVRHELLKCDLQLITAELSDAETEQLLRVLLDYALYEYRTLAYSLGHFATLSEFITANLDRLFSIVRPNRNLHELLIQLLGRGDIDLGQHLAEVIDYGLVASRTCKSSFQYILEPRKIAARPILLQRLTSGTALQRMRAAEWLDKLFGSEIAADLGKALTFEQDKQVRATLEKLYSVHREADEYQRRLSEQLTLPAVAIETGEMPLPAGFTVKFQKFLDESLERGREEYKRAMHRFAMREQADVRNASPRPVSPVPPSPDDLLALYLYMEGKADSKPPKNDWLYGVLLETQAIEQWCDPWELKLLQVLRLLDAVGGLQERFSALTVYHFELLNAHRRSQNVPYGLREIDAAAEHLLGRPHLMSRGYLMDRAPYDLEDTAVWPAFVDQLQLLEDSIAGVPLDQYDRHVADRRQTALAITGMLPVLPRQLEEAAWALALADGWTLRPLARPLLKRQANCVQRAIAALAHRSSGARMGAAEILQELQATEAIEPLKKAFNKEKQRPVQGHLLTALEKLGANVDEFIGRDKLLQDATKGNQKLLRSMVWFPLDEVPVVRWANDNEPIPKIVMRWWLIQCVEFKSTTCSPVMRRALELCRRDDTLRLAHFILDQWISFDTDEPSRIEVEKRIRAQVQKLSGIFQLAKKDNSKDIEEHINRMVNQEMRDIQRQQSAHTERGLLAIVAAFGDDKCVEKIEKYIRNYHGNRALQAKSMLEVIPQIDAPISLRVIRSLAAGFRNAAICQRAGELFREMSQRYGWSEEELAERILPDAGFAHPTSDSPVAQGGSPEMILSYGQRDFRALVKDDFEIVVVAEDGTLKKDLPKATKEDDKTLVRVAKEQLKTARDIVRSTKQQLTERLYEAMCQRRLWSVKEWRELLVDHVLAGIACRRLIWSIQSDRDSEATFFQWMADGTALDASGNCVQLSDEGLISVAHPSQMVPSMEQFWSNHLLTQGIRPLFPQTCDGIGEEVGPS